MSEEIRQWVPNQDLLFLAKTPVVYHCHHYNLALDQTIEDALGFKRAAEVKRAAAREAATQLLAEFCELVEAQTPSEILQASKQLLQAMGHGSLDVLWDGESGEAHGEYLHYSYSWKEKYGDRVKCKTPRDQFAAGWAAATAQMISELPPCSVESKELECYAMRQPRCRFELSLGEPEAPRPTIGITESEDVLRSHFGGLYEDEIEKYAAVLKEFTAGISGDERGLVEAFGVFVTMTPSVYYNRISYDSLMILQEEAPAFVPVLEALLREAGHVCVFNTFGGILASPEWESVAGGAPSSPEEIVWQSMSIARALGFGHWTVQEFELGKRLVMSAPVSYETPYYMTRHGETQEHRHYVFQGAAVALMQLAHRVDFLTNPVFDTQFYAQLFKNNKLKWRHEETRNPFAGDDRLEVVVTLDE